METGDTRVTALVARVAQDELREDETIRRQLLHQFREWISQHDNIVNCRTDDNFLLRFLRVRKFSLLSAEQTLLRFLKLTQSFSHLMRDLDFQAHDIRTMLDDGFIVVSPYRDDEGRQVLILNYGVLDVEKHTYEGFTRAIQLTQAMVMEDEASQVLGYVHIINLLHVSPKILGAVSIPECLHFVQFLEHALPMRHKLFHLINLPNFMAMLYNGIKNLLTKKLQERLLVHRSIEELNDHINPKCLPKELGGSMPFEKMKALWFAKLEADREVMLGLDAMHLRDLKAVDEELGFSGTIGDLRGSFRKLDID